MIETDTAESSSEQTGSQSTLLLVDDEENILASLRRLFRPAGYRLLTATNGREGLQLMELEHVDMVLSDMRMPEMDGARFLEQVARRWPDTIRILLTGFADIGATIEAINKGHIYRYISKPWEDNDIRLTVRHALEQQRLENEKRRLEELTNKQNEVLKELNSGLEAKVKARTAELEQMYQMLQTAYGELRRSYVAMVPVFANFVELGEGELQGHGKRIASVARDVAVKMGFGEREVESVYFAGLLHDIGKLGIPDEIVNKPYGKLTAQERQRFEKHPAMGQAALMAVEPLLEAGRLIRHHHERYDGKGYPDRLAGDAIPLGARILAVANDFDALQLGTLLGECLSAAQARGFLQIHRNQRYDPRVVDVFCEVIRQGDYSAPSADILRLFSGDLVEGMVLVQDLYNEEGILLLTAGYQLTRSVIDKIRKFEGDENKRLVIHVRAG